MLGLLRFGTRWMCRAVLAALTIVFLLVFVDPHWARESLTLSLRLRTGGEAMDAAQRWVRAAREGELPPVASPSDVLTEEDRRRLDRLLEEKLRE